MPEDKLLSFPRSRLTLSPLIWHRLCSVISRLLLKTAIRMSTKNVMWGSDDVMGYDRILESLLKESPEGAPCPKN